ncbi:MAG: hypothetical protein ACI9MR_002529 [Myxococcota bacterium]|jgi:hypothetical protein
MNAADLPIPKVQRTFQPSHFKTIAKVLGIALIVQWLIPLGDGMMMWNALGFGTVWALLAGIGLTVLGFVDVPALKTGHKLAIAAGIGVLGLFSIATMPIWFYVGFFGLFGLMTLAFGLYHWARNGYSQLAFIVVCVGVGLMALSLLIPMGRGGVPIVAMFKALGGPIMYGLFLMLTSLLYIGLAVLVVMFVILKKDKAELGIVSALANGTFLFLPVALFLIGFFGMFHGGALLLASFHFIVMVFAYSFLTLWAGVQLVELMQKGELADKF